MIANLLQGLLIGIALALPGLSAGTIILILGFYRRFLDDLAVLRLKPYIYHFGGALAGALATVYFIGYLLQNHKALIIAFIFGMLVASIPLVIAYRSGKPIKIRSFFFAALGFYLSWFIICEPQQTFTALPPGGQLHFFLGGALSSATMLLPGVSGSAVLIMINLYDKVIYAITNWQWLKLAAFAAGFLVGFFSMARLLSTLYRRYQLEISFLLAGLIAGSTRTLLPANLDLRFFLLALVGGALVYFISRSRLAAR